MTRRTLLFVVAAACLRVSAAAASGTATLTGVATGPEGTPVPAAAVTVAGDALIEDRRETTTGTDGSFRVMALPPGAYVVTLRAAGRRPVEGQVRLHAGETVRLDVRLHPGAASDAPAGPPPAAVAVREGAVSTEFSSSLLASLPLEDRAGTGWLRLAPGIDGADASAFGDAGAAANAYALEDLNAADPERGTPWIRPALHWIEEAQVHGPGTGARAGGFTGAASRTLFRSGGRAFHGLAEVLYGSRALGRANLLPGTGGGTTASREQPARASDTSVQAGGPLRAETVWIFAGLHVRHARLEPAGYPADRPAGVAGGGAAPGSPAEISPRLLVKPTWRTGSGDVWSGFLIADRYAAEARGASARVAPEATVRERTAALAWNGRYSRLPSSSTAFEAAYSGFHGSASRSPYNGATPGRYDVTADYYSGNSSYEYDADRGRHQGRAGITKFLSRAGHHEISGGIEIDAGSVRRRDGYPGGRSIDTAGPLPLFLYLWEGSTREVATRRLGAYVQDAWALGARTRLDAGVRLDRGSAVAPGGGSIYAALAAAPRVGLTWAPGEGRTAILRGHYGWYFDEPETGRLDAVAPGIAPVFGVPVDARLSPIGPRILLVPGTRHRPDAGLRQVRAKQAVAGADYRATQYLTAGIYAIDRRTDRFVDDMLPAGPGFVKTTVRDAGPDGFPTSGDETAISVDVYTQVTDPAGNTLAIANLPGAFRTYRALLASATLSLGARGELRGSWVWSRTTGNYDGSPGGLSPEYDSPNTDPAFQPARTGRAGTDRTHAATMFGTYRLPLQVRLSGALYYAAGRPLTRTQAVRVNDRRIDVMIEPRGAGRYDPETRIDLRLERQFPAGGSRRIALVAEAFNLLDAAVVTERVTRSGLSYAAPVTLMAPRQVRVGAAWRF